MKGQHHLISGIIFLFLIFAIDLITGLRFYSFLSSTNLTINLLMFYLFFTGVLLPDSDKFGSWIYKFFFPFAIISSIAGIIISTMKGKRFKHRGVLHSSIGIIISSMISTIFVFFIASLFLKIEPLTLLLFFISILTGQILHLLFD